MGTQKNLSDIIAGYPKAYQTWGAHLDFHACVTRAIGQNEADLAVFEAAWREAIDFKHWRLPDLARCARMAEAAVSARFPELSKDAVQRLVNAAAFEWK